MLATTANQNTSLFGLRLPKDTMPQTLLDLIFGIVCEVWQLGLTIYSLRTFKGMRAGQDDRSLKPSTVPTYLTTAVIRSECPESSFLGEFGTHRRLQSNGLVVCRENTESEDYENERSARDLSSDAQPVADTSETSREASESDLWASDEEVEAPPGMCPLATPS